MTGKTDTEGLQLLSRAASGDIESYQELFNRHSEKLYNFIYYLTYSREEAEDITQDAFIKVYEALQGRDVSNLNFRAYLYKAARNLSLNAMARRKREGLTLEEALEFKDPSVFSDPEKAALLSEQRSKVLQASGDLTDDQQIALLLKETAGFRYDAISEVLDTNPNAVGALLSRARLKFREVFRMAYAQTEGVPENCTRITPLLSKYIDGEATPQETYMVESHLADCPICRGNMESMKEASVTYRSLIPVLPLASLKVWGAAEAALIGSTVVSEAAGAAAGAGAGAGTAAGTTAAGGATVATTAAATVATTAGVGIAAKIVAIVAAVLVTTGVGIGGYFGVKNTIFAKKEVPLITGVSEQEAKQKVENAGLKFEPKYTHDYRTGNEVVVEQSLKGGDEVDEGTVITGTLEDKDMQSAREQAKGAVGGANTSLTEVQAMGIDTSDLAGPIQNAQSKLDNAKTVDELVGPTDSAAYWAGVVINGCNEKTQAYLAQQERERQIANCKAAMLAVARESAGPDLTRVWLEDFWMDNSSTRARAIVQGIDSLGRISPAGVEAARQGDTWVITYFGTG